MNHAEPAAALMPGAAPSIFSLVPLSAEYGQCTFSIELDPQEPYLDDHRPGGDPLLSTVMAVEAAVSGARFIARDAAPASVTQVNVFEPYTLAAKRPPAIDLRVVRIDDVTPAFRCVLSSVQNGRTLPHLEAVVTFDASTPVTLGATIPPFAQSPNSPRVGPLVNGAQVYRLFFHGPSFQVIDAAQYHDGRMVCRLNRNLPPGHRKTGTASQISPRLIEFALQSAGLLEVATNGRMKIPHSIGSITRYRPIDVDEPATLSAIASYGSTDEQFIDAEIVDTSGRIVLRVEKYRTVALPFALNSDRVATLRAQLRGAWSAP